MIINKHNIDTAFANLRLQADVIIDKGGLVEASVKKKVNRRSLNQNAWLHCMFDIMAKFCFETGFNPLNVKYTSSLLLKEFFKAYFGVKSTAKLSTVEFNDFIEKVQNYFMVESGGEFEFIDPQLSEEQLKERYGEIRW